MGTVYLTSGHHFLYVRNDPVDLKRRIALKKEVLDRPILHGGSPVSEERQPIIRAALLGLMNLAGFDAAVSFGLTEKDGVSHLAIPHREWGEITLDEPHNVVVPLSHDSRHTNVPFRRVWQWCEDETPHGGSSDEERASFVIKWSSEERWLAYFQDRIRREELRLRNEDYELRREAHKVYARAGAIELALKLSYKK